MLVPLSWLDEFVPLTSAGLRRHVAALAGVDEDRWLEGLCDRLALLGFGHEAPQRVADDIVLNLEVASNRPDLLSVLGIARVLAAAWGLDVHTPDGAGRQGGPPTRELASVTIEEPALCPRYTAQVISGIRVGPSPGWMAHRLEASGIRSINNVVDVTNYVMLEQGQPLHAFDLDRLADRRIIVRRARHGERLVTLDGIERSLEAEMLVIADGDRAVALAGVMGGGESEIGPSTTRVLLEAAAFAAPQVRRTSRRLGLRTESSARFERAIDPRSVLDAARRAAALLVEVAGGEIAPEPIDAYPDPQPLRVITLRLPRVSRVLGLEVPAPEVEAILRRLGAGVARDGDRLTVTAPAGRVDLEREEDLIEEVARHHGYEHIPETLPIEVTQPGRRDERVEAERVVRSALTRAGLTEAVTISLIHPRVFDRLGLATDDPVREAVPLANPFLADHTHLRTMILPGLLDAMRVNQSRRVEEVHFFEVGHVFRWRGGRVDETRALGLAMTGRLMPRAWTDSDEDHGVTFFDLKGVVDVLLRELGLAASAEPAPPGAHSWLHPGRAALLRLDGEVVGTIGELHPLAAQRWDLRGRVYVGEVDIDAVLARAIFLRRFTALPRFPAVERDVAVLVSAGVSHAAAEEVIREAGGTLLQSIVLFDVYEGAPIPAGHRSLAFRLAFRATDRTLTSEEVDEVVTRIQDSLRRQLQAEVRG